MFLFSVKVTCPLLRKVGYWGHPLLLLRLICDSTFRSTYDIGSAYVWMDVFRILMCPWWIGLLMRMNKPSLAEENQEGREFGERQDKISDGISSHLCDGILDRLNLRQVGFILAHSLRRCSLSQWERHGRVHVVGGCGWDSLDLGGQGSRKTEIPVLNWLSPFPIFYAVQEHSLMGWCHPHSGSIF